MANITCTGLSDVALEMCITLNAVPLECAFNEYPYAGENGTVCMAYSSPVEKVTGMLGEQSVLDPGNTAFMLASAALVMIMTPGLALFYAGLAGEESAANTILMSIACMVLVTFQWFFVGYTFSFGPGTPGFGSFEWFSLLPINGKPSGVYGVGIPHILWVIFQCMFAQITPAIISGSVVGRMKFSSFCVFVIIWTTLIYDPLAHWFWSLTLDDTFTYTALGWLGKLGAIDFAGGEVIHISSGFSALAAALVLGKRYNAGEPLKPHNVPLVMMGASFIWFGWFGFNAGSAAAASGLASHAFLCTHLAAASAGVTWMILEKVTGGQPTAAGLASGVVAGLVAITPGCGFVHFYAAFLFGILTAPVCFFMMKLKSRMGIDDTLDAFALHGCGGVVGSLLTGLFATKDINAVAGGFYYGEMQFGLQLLGVVISAAYSFFGTLIIMLVLKYTIGVRVSDEKERVGIDVSEHGGKSYTT